jgi:hypothetical protein
MKSVQLVAMFGFIFTVVDFISSPFGDQTREQRIEPHSTSAVIALPPTAPSSDGRSTSTLYLYLVTIKFLIRAIGAKIQVQIDSPQVLVPGPDASKSDHIVADLGDFSMHNYFESAEPTLDGSQTFVCTLSKMHMRSIRGEIETDILHDVKLDVLVISERGAIKVILLTSFLDLHYALGECRSTKNS